MKKDFKGFFVKNTLFSVIQQSITTLTIFSLMPYMIWRMGTEGYGFWMVLQIFSIGGCLSLVEMGFQGSIIRYMTKYYTEHNIEEFKNLYFSGIILFHALGILCCIAVLLFNKYLFLKIFSIPPEHADKMQAGLVIYAFSFLFQLPVMVLKAFYTSIQDFLKLKLWETLNILSFALAIFIIMFYATDVFTVVVVETIVHFIFFVIFFIAPLKYYKELYFSNTTHFSLDSLKNISGMTTYLFFYRIFGLIYNRTPQIFIAYFLTPNFMTYYEIINKIPRTLKLMQGVINSAVLPLAVSLDTLKYQDKMKQLFLRGTRYSFLFVTPIVAFVLFYANDILRLWIGTNYVFLANYLRVYTLWQYFNFFISFGQSMYTRTEHFKSMLPYYVFGTALLLIFMSLYMERLELWAVLLGLLLSSSVVIPSNMVIINKINKFSLPEFFIQILQFPIILGALFCVILLFLMKTYLPTTNIILLLVYAAVMYLLYLTVFYRYYLLNSEKKDINLLIQKL